MVKYETAAVEKSGAMTLKQVTDRVNMVHQVLKNVMQGPSKENPDGVHYGTVPGCGKKMVLLKPGADVLAMTFRLVPQFKLDRTDLGNGHREYDVTCSMFGPDGTLLGQGVGSASTKEKKYRYRWEGSGQNRRRVENEDIADVYNTVLKMAKKRAHVDATLTATGAADLFTQDLIDEDGEQAEQRTSPKPPTKKAAPKQSEKQADGETETAEVVVENVGSKDMAKGTRYWIKADDGQYYSTFSDTIGADIMQLQAGETVKIGFERTQGANGEFRTIRALELAGGGQAEDGDNVGF